MSTPSTTSKRLSPGRREVFVPLFALTLAVAALALVISFYAAQPGKTPVAQAMVMSGGPTSDLVQPKLDAAKNHNWDMVAKRYDPSTAPVAAGPKTFDLTMAEHRIKMGDSVATVWTFNGTSPGPVLRAVVGDTITIHLKNAASSKMPHSMDFHASRMSMGGGDVQVAPGTTGTFTFTAETPGVFMYHCATSPVLEHIGRGMYGMLIVQPKDGFGEKMPEYAVVQSELYTSFADMKTGNNAAVVMNGIPGQYVADPIHLPADSKARIFFVDAGPAKVSSFHVVGTIFDRALADGNPLNATYGRQTIAVPTSGGEALEMQLRGEGEFFFVTHQFHDANSGAVGAFLTGDGKRGPGALAQAMNH